MSVSRTALSRVRRQLARFEQARGGSTAVEFAMLALPFLALIFGIIELGLIYLIATTLSNATTDAARQIRTCQLQNQGGATAATFQAQICNNLAWLGSNCTANLSVDVRTFTSFANTSVPDPIVNGQLNQASLQFQMGAAGDIVLVRTYYPWTLIAPLLDGSLARLSNGQTLISATSAFRNEPCS